MLEHFLSANITFSSFKTFILPPFGLCRPGRLHRWLPTATPRATPLQTLYVMTDVLFSFLMTSVRQRLETITVFQFIHSNGNCIGMSSGVPGRVGGWGSNTPLPRNSGGPPKSCQSRPDCENC